MVYKAFPSGRAFNILWFKRRLKGKMEYLHTTADSKFDGAWAKGIPLDDEARPPLGNFFRIRDKITCMGCSKTYGPEGFPVIPKKTVMSFNSNSNDVRLPL